MELEVIRHKTAELFFTGFFPEEVAASYSYQLQRMFESGAAREGDYFVVKKDGRPYLNVEIYRNNTRRIWEKGPSFAMGIIPTDKNEIRTAMETVFDFLDDTVYYYKPEDSLEILLSDEWKESELMKEIILSHGYSKFGGFEEYLLETPENFTEPERKISFKPFTDLDPEERFNLVHENDVAVNIFEHIAPDKLYQDYIEEGYDSEPLWRFFNEGEDLAGFIMPVFTSGFKKELRLLNYHSGSSPKDFSEEAVSEILRVAKENNVQKLTFTAKSKDDKLKSALKDIGATLTHTFERYAKK